MKILVVDDDQICRTLISKGLEKAGYQTIEASNAREALGVLSGQEPIALAILDIMMPDLDGLGLLHFLRKQPWSAQLPVILCTTLNTREIAVRAARLNVAAHLVKPIDLRQLREKVQQIMEKVPKVLGDPQAAAARLDLDGEAYCQMLDSLADAVSKGIEELTGLISERDAKTAAVRISALYGGSENLGADRLGDTLTRLQRLCGQAELETAEAMLPQIKREVAMLRACTQELRKEPADQTEQEQPVKT